MESAYKDQGLQPQSHPERTRTPDWPAEPAYQTMSPLWQAPYRHLSHSSQMAQWKKQRKTKKREKGRECREPLNYNWIHNAKLTEQWTHCNHVGQQCTYQPRILLDNLSPRVLMTLWLINTTERVKRLTNANRWPRQHQRPTKNATDQTGSWS